MDSAVSKRLEQKHQKQGWKEIGLEDEHSEADPDEVVEYLEQGRTHQGDYLLPDTEQSGSCDCNADRIDKLPHRAIETVWWRNSEGDYIVETEDMKGHRYRDMAVFREHGLIPEDDQNWDETVEKMFERAATQIRNDPEVSDDLALYVGLNDIPHHYHVIVSDVDSGTGSPSNDLNRLDNFALYDLSGEYGIEDPDYFEIGDVRGEIGLKPHINPEKT